MKMIYLLEKVEKKEKENCWLGLNRSAAAPDLRHRRPPPK